MCLEDIDCPGTQLCCGSGYCCGGYYYSYWGTGSIVGLVVGLVILKILIVSCIVYFRRRRTIPYMVAPNTTTVATVVQTNHGVQQPVGQPYYPVPPHTAQVNAAPAKPPPAYSTVVPAQV